MGGETAPGFTVHRPRTCSNRTGQTDNVTMGKPPPPTARIACAIVPRITLRWATEFGMDYLPGHPWNLSKWMDAVVWLILLDGEQTRTSMDPAHLLDEILSGATEIIIVCHNNPDPDCLAGAHALGRLAEAAGIDEKHILYSGDISHQENRAFINLLEIPLQPFDPAVVTNRPADSLLAFVDHAVPGQNNRVPEGTPVDIVIDHHDVEDIVAEFVDHRPTIGATATILTEYVRTLDLDMNETLATALLFAIRQETLSFLRGTTAGEYAAAGYLHESVDNEMLLKLARPAVTGSTIDAIATAINNRLIQGAVLISHVGRTSERDAIPQAADYLVILEGVETAIVFGIVNDTVQLSARSTDTRVHIGDVLREAFAEEGTGGGHQGMGGAEIPLGIFADYTEDDERLLGIVDQVVTARLVASLNLTDIGENRSDTSDA